MTEKVDSDTIFSFAWFRFMNLWSKVDNLRIVAQAGLPQAKTVLERENIGFMAKLISDPQYDGLIANKENFMKTVGIDDAGRMMMEMMLISANIALDAASIVLAHSILDAFLYELCKITLAADPQGSEKLIEKRQITFAESRDKNSDQLREELLDKYLSQLEWKSLLKKCELLYIQCKPEAGFSGAKNYEYDSTKLDDFDKLRHDIVHGLRINEPLDNIEEQLEYARKTGVHFMVLLNSRYGLRINALLYPKFISAAK